MLYHPRKSSVDRLEGRLNSCAPSSASFAFDTAFDVFLSLGLQNVQGPKASQASLRCFAKISS
jgi:hypothetical protein